MKIVLHLFMSYAIILNSIELSLQSEHSPDKGLPSGSTQKPSGSTDRPRSRSPSLRRTFPNVLGFRFEDLLLIRLKPHNSPFRVFKLRTYVFPPGKQIGLRTRNSFLNPMPAGEQIVLSTSNGDICALLEKSTYKHTVLRGIFQSVFKRSVRVKINIYSGDIEEMRDDEIVACPVSTHESVTKIYEVSRLDDPSSAASASSPARAVSPLSNTSNPRTLRKTFPTILGFKYDDLEFIRLSPHKYPDRTFEFRIYAFTQVQQIALKTKNNMLVPIPTGEQIVLSTSNGEVCALLEKPSGERPNFRPMYSFVLRISERVKINVKSGLVEAMTKEEIAECSVRSGRPIRQIYRVYRT